MNTQKNENEIEEKKKIIFPDIKDDDFEELIYETRELSPELLVEAYKKGAFPWPYDEESDVIPFYSPLGRFIITKHSFHLSESIIKTIKKSNYNIKIDNDFESVINNCYLVRKNKNQQTWLSKKLISQYIELHKMGYAHSVEVYNGNKLVGGFYGISMGNFFEGESMFTFESNSTKVGFALFALNLFKKGFEYIDAQSYTDNMARYGAFFIPRYIFLENLRKNIKEMDKYRGLWTDMFDLNDKSIVEYYKEIKKSQNEILALLNKIAPLLKK